MTWKRFFKIAVALIIICFVSLFICNKIIADNAKGKLYSASTEIPYNRVGILLGTSKTTINGYGNAFYNNRINAAIELLKNNKIKYLVISGDNGRTEYDEPTAMRTDLINAGIDSNRLFLDYAGFRTFDSMKRLKEVFGQDAVTIISQQFHNERALYIAKRLNISAIAFNAKDVSSSVGFRTIVREKFARAKVFLDFWFGKEPKFLGPKVILPE